MRRLPASPHKLPGAISGVLIPETLPSVSKGPSYPDTNRQHYDGGLHQSSGGLMLPSITLASAQVDSLELQSVSIPSDDVLKAEADMASRGTHRCTGNGPYIRCW